MINEKVDAIKLNKAPNRTARWQLLSHEIGLLSC